MEADIDPVLVAARDHVVEKYMGRPGVNGVGIGAKTVAGRRSGVTSIRVYVTRKRPSQYLPAGTELPRSIRVKGRTVAIDVVQAGPFFPLHLLSRADETRSLAGAATEDAYPHRYRPVPFGVSIAHQDVTAGTVGCLVTDNTDGSTVVLSNNHVLANSNLAEIGDPIVQPGPADQGIVGPDTVAHLKRYVEIKIGTINYADAAIATPVGVGTFVNESPEGVINPISSQHQPVGLLFAGDCSGMILACSASRIASLLDVSFPNGFVVPSAYMLVEKVGRTTGWTVSSISDIGLEMKVAFPGGVATFGDLFMMERFGHAGDSGSIIVQAEA